MPQPFFYTAKGLRLTANLVSWDSQIFGFPVAAIDSLDIQDPALAGIAYQAFQEWLDANSVKMVSCRLAHQKLRESMFLENRGFRFVEMVLHPHLGDLGAYQAGTDSLVIAVAEESDLENLQAIAENAFTHERYHLDPRLDSRYGDLRYGRWVRNSFAHPRQQLLKISDQDRIVAFFVVETDGDGNAYWHLTAVAPQHQGRGYGRRAWQAMLRHHRQAGLSSVSSTISARNIIVLNLYAKLGFRFLPPEMTFHWIKDAL